MENYSFSEEDVRDEIDAAIELKRFLGDKIENASEEGMILENVQELNNYKDLIAYIENDFGEKEMDEMERREMLMNVEKIVDLIESEGGKVYVVGGYARDEALKRFGYNLQSKDVDLEVYGMSFDRIKELLSDGFWDIDLVGESFQVLKVDNSIDISIPRKDSKKGEGHSDFIVGGDPEMSIEDATKRRDFTINALLYDLRTGKIIDPYSGLKDLQRKVIRHVDDETFGDDPLRVLRAMQFAGRFGFDIDEKTTEIAKNLSLAEISKERFFEEWVKLLMKSSMPSMGLEAGKKMGVLEKIYPEIDTLDQVEEGNPWIQAKEMVDAAARISREENVDKENQLILMITSLCCSLRGGEEVAKGFLKKINASKVIIEKIVPLVREKDFSIDNLSQSMIRNLSAKLYPATIEQFVLLLRASNTKKELCDELRKMAMEMNLEKDFPRPIKTASYLMEDGVSPGPLLGVLEKILFEAQLDGKFSNVEGAKMYYQENKDFLLDKAGEVMRKIEEAKKEELEKRFQ